MELSIRELKRRYRENLALGRALPTHDLGVPLPLRAQPKTFKIGAIHPVTGALAEPG